MRCSRHDFSNIEFHFIYEFLTDPYFDTQHAFRWHNHLTKNEVIRRILMFSISPNLPKVCTFLLVLTVRTISWAYKKASVVDLSMKVASIAQKELH